MLQVDIHNGRKYITTERHGVAYTLMRNGDAWAVRSRRLSLGRFNFGGVKHYDTLQAVVDGCKAFAALDIVTAF